MVKIVLENGTLDIRDDVKFPLNFSVGDIRDISKRTGTFSKTIIAPGTKNNHELLGHYYDVNIQAGTFDINTITKCQVIQNGVPVLEDALIQLTGVIKKQNTNAYEEDINYELLIKDSKVEFFTQIANKELTDLDFSDLSHTLDSAFIVSSFSNTEADGFKYILPYSDDNTYRLNEFKPAIFAKTYFDRIFSNAGFSYTWSGLQDAKFDKLLIPYNGDVEQADVDYYKVVANNTWTTSYVSPIGLNPTFYEVIDSWTEVIDVAGLFDPVTGVYDAPLYTDTTQGQYYNFKLSYTADINLDNTSGGNAYSVSQQQGTIVPEDRYYKLHFRLIKNGTTIVGQYTISGFGILFDASSALPNGLNTLTTISQVVTIPTNQNIAPTDTIEVQVGLSFVSNDTANTFWRDAAAPVLGALAQVNHEVDITSLQLEVLPNNAINLYNGTVSVNGYVPSKIKQSDFVKSIFQMYNLYVEIDEDQPNNLILEHRDNYYDSGAVKDWTYKLAKDREQNLQFLPEVTSKKLRLTYKADKDSPNTIFTEITNEIYGQIEYTFDNEYVRDTDVKELVFSPTPVVRTNFDAYVPNIAGAAPKINIRILLDGGVETCLPYDIYDIEFPLTPSLSVGTTGITTYPAVGHFDNPLLPTFDINFGTCDYYYYATSTLTNNNLYNLYWRRTINQINVGKMLSAYFDLNELDIQSLRLNDKIRIDNSWWNINKVIDYDANGTSLTKVELISVDSEIELVPFQTGNGKPLEDTIVAVSSDSVVKTRTLQSNVILGDAEVKGRGNVVGQNVKALVEGYGQSLAENGIVTQNLQVETINGVSVSNALPTYKKYIANISQAGTSDPTLSILENDLGDIVWNRIGAGQYDGVLLGAFPTSSQVYAIIQSFNIYAAHVAIYNSDADTIQIFTLDNTYAPVDGVLFNTTLEIRVYP
jgi:hypothetical protein